MALSFAQAVHRESNACDEWNPKWGKADEKDKRHEQNFFWGDYGYYAVCRFLVSVKKIRETSRSYNEGLLVLEGWGFIESRGFWRHFSTLGDDEIKILKNGSW